MYSEVLDREYQKLHKPCYFCGKKTGPEYYCFGCHTVICGECDHESEWPPAYHKKPEEHPIRYKGKRKVKKMSKTEQLEQRLRDSETQLETMITSRDNLAKSISALQEYHRNDIKALKAQHADQLDKLAKQACQAIERSAELNLRQVLQAERDAVSQAYKYLVDSVTANKAG